MVQIVLELNVFSCMYVCVWYVWTCLYNQWAFYITLKCLKLDVDLTIVFLLFYFCYNIILSLGLRLFYVLCKARGLKWYKIQTNFIIHNIYWLNAMVISKWCALNLVVCFSSIYSICCNIHKWFAFQKWVNFRSVSIWLLVQM